MRTVTTRKDGDKSQKIKYIKYDQNPLRIFENHF